MTERVLNRKKNGLAALVLTVLLYLAALGATIWGAVLVENNGAPWLMVGGIVWLSLGWIPLLGLKVLRPQEALVLTLFGRYVGTLKGDGF
ncbi:MAG: SPFH domain-containing protein, partial [Oscillospiraceae bacterium]|nr:SPFH domain-containing protein [Oscillospiraceae bacterium]